MTKFTLYAHQVPCCPDAPTWFDCLRWLVVVMNPDDRSLLFVASCLSHAIKNNGLTEKQGDACAKVFERVCRDFNAGLLLCQNTGPSLKAQESFRKGMN